MVHEARSVSTAGHVMVALSGMVSPICSDDNDESIHAQVTVPGVLNGDAHILVAEATAGASRIPTWSSAICYP